LVVTNCAPGAESNAADGANLAIVGCTLPEIVADVKVGDRFYYDDGALSGKAIVADGQSFTVEISYACKGRKKVKPDKGINLPDTDFRISSLTPKDVDDLDFIVAHADMVGMSFVRSATDVDQLVNEIVRRNAQGLGIVLKIETRRAFEELPKLMLSAMRVPPVGVMVARGDMGVELGFRRMAEVQEEVLWLAEAAHVPVIWATQVLENLAKYGMPSRAEVTDAAMSGRAECVMLNKGEHIVETVRFLDDILRRMSEHQHKKLAMLRKLSISERI
jgi:pyruvate kinase